MSRSLREQAIDIWKSGVRAVDSERLVGEALSVDRGVLRGRSRVSLGELSRIVVIGAGKAGAGMAAAVEQALPPEVLAEAGCGGLCGFVNVPGDCVRPLPRIHLHPARPAGVNEPTQDGVEGSMQILALMRSLTASDLAIVLLSGGGGVLLPAPAEGISLDDKQTVTRRLMHRGATIQELNCVRKQLSRVKGGRLAAAAAAGKVLVLIISDVIGDPLDVIASGPTVPDSSTPAEALEVLRKFVPDHADIPDAVWSHLKRASSEGGTGVRIDTLRVFNHVIGNNAVAVEAAVARARECGFDVRNAGSDLGGVASETGREFARMCLQVRDEATSRTEPICVISGGEPVVHLAETDQPRKGGRNQELVLAAADYLWNTDHQEMVILSGGTDGEDGPTDAAGAFVDAEVLESARHQGLAPDAFLAINNSYEFFEKAGGLLRTGPTHTNVMDLRVALVGR